MIAKAHISIGSTCHQQLHCRHLGEPAPSRSVHALRCLYLPLCYPDLPPNILVIPITLPIIPLIFHIPHIPRITLRIILRITHHPFNYAELSTIIIATPSTATITTTTTTIIGNTKNTRMTTSSNSLKIIAIGTHMN